MAECSGLVRRRRAALGGGADALIPVDIQRYRAEALAGLAVRDRLRRHVAAVSHREPDHGGSRRTRMTPAHGANIMTVFRAGRAP